MTKSVLLLSSDICDDTRSLVNDLWFNVASDTASSEIWLEVSVSSVFHLNTSCKCTELLALALILEMSDGNGSLRVCVITPSCGVRILEVRVVYKARWSRVVLATETMQNEKQKHVTS